MSGIADMTPTDNVLTFSVSPGWTTLGVGLGTTTVAITSLGSTSVTVTINLEVEAAAPTLIVQGGVNTLNPIAFLAGAVAPTMTLTVLSSNGLPLAFTVAANSNTTPEGVPGGLSGTGWLTSAVANGIAYSWGTTLSFTASAAATTQQALPGDTLTASIIITPAGQGPVIIPVSIAVSAAPPTLSGVSPNIVPLLVSPVAAGSVTLVVHGTNFVSGTGVQKTKVFVGATLAAATQVSTANVTVLSPNYLTVTVPYASTGIPFATAGATALLVGVNNGASPTAPAIGATATIAVTAAPIISSIASGSSFVEYPTPRAAPYDIVSIFGSNLCTLCTGANNILLGVPDPVFSRFPAFLSPDGGTHKLTVTFSLPGTPATNLPGYLLFATNNQINVLVPGALATLEGTVNSVSGLVNVQVGYDTVTPAINVSAYSQVTYTLHNPGIFTIESDGQGQGAITDGVTFVLNSSATAPTPPWSSSAPTLATVAIFMTGLGTPTSLGTNVVTSSPTYFTDCLAPLGTVGTSSTAPGGYMGTINTPYFASVTATGLQQAATYVVPATLWTSIDGAVLTATELEGNYPPCFATSVPTVSIGGSAATVTYAGFVSGSVTGLYQIDAELPTPAASQGGAPPYQYPVVVTVGGIPSQPGVTMWLNY